GKGGGRGWGRKRVGSRRSNTSRAERGRGKTISNILRNESSGPTTEERLPQPCGGTNGARSASHSQEVGARERVEQWGTAELEWEETSRALKATLDPLELGKDE
ncbi:unnamed protein product, partial [Discosporangium mesarthrocarpum]